MCGRPMRAPPQRTLKVFQARDTARDSSYSLRGYDATDRLRYRPSAGPPPSSHWAVGDKCLAPWTQGDKGHYEARIDAIYEDEEEEETKCTVIFTDARILGAPEAQNLRQVGNLEATSSPSYSPQGQSGQHRDSIVRERVAHVTRGGGCMHRHHAVPRFRRLHELTTLSVSPPPPTFPRRRPIWAICGPFQRPRPMQSTNGPRRDAPDSLCARYPCTTWGGGQRVEVAGCLLKTTLFTSLIRAVHSGGKVWPGWTPSHPARTGDCRGLCRCAGHHNGSTRSRGAAVWLGGSRHTNG